MYLCPMELKPGIGIDNLVFGMYEPEVMDLIGDPDRTFTNEDDENEVIYQYNALKMRFTFYRHQERKLGYIRCGNNKVTYKGQPLLGQSIQQVIEHTLKDFQPWQTDSYEFFDVYTHEEKYIVLNVEYEEVADLELGVPFEGEDGYRWP